jgi:hypothetical protein
MAKALAEYFQRHGQERDWKDIRGVLERVTSNGAVPPFLDLIDDLRMCTGGRESTVLLTVDQAEELFSTGAPDEDASLLLFRRIIEEGADRLMVIATLRSDFLARFQEHSALEGLPCETLSVGRMSAGGLRMVIGCPAQVAGVALEEALTEQLLADAKTSDALPLLAFALRELWERYRKDDRRLELREYLEALGGLEGSIKRAVDGVIRVYIQETKRRASDPTEARLTSQDERDLRSAFLSMVWVNDEGQLTRTAAAWRELAAGIHPLLDRFVNARILIRDMRHEPLVEVAHESLFHCWDQLRGWLDEDREFLLWRKRLRRLRLTRGSLTRYTQR